MYLFLLSFNRCYLHSPKTWLHKTKSRKKICFIFFNLLYLPYLNTTYIIILFFIYIIIAITLKIPSKYITSYIKLFIPIIIFTIISIITNQKKLYDYLLFPLKIFLPIKILSINILFQYKIFIFSLYILKWKTYIIKIPIFILRINIISIIYLLSLHLLFLTTTYENLILVLLIPINKIIDTRVKKIILISAFSIQFLELIIDQFKKLIITIKLRGLTYQSIIQFNNIYIIFIYSWNTFCSSINNDIKRISSILYTRKIQKINFEDLHLLN